jgi:hypothetical protein
MKYSYAVLSLGSWLLGGCSVYTPMLGAAPGLKAKGELEATAAWSLTNRLDVGATYSPVRHLLVRAAAITKGGGRAAPNHAVRAGRWGSTGWWAAWLVLGKRTPRPATMTMAPPAS